MHHTLVVSCIHDGEKRWMSWNRKYRIFDFPYRTLFFTYRMIESAISRIKPLCFLLIELSITVSNQPRRENYRFINIDPRNSSIELAIIDLRKNYRVPTSVIKWCCQIITPIFIAQEYTGSEQEYTGSERSGAKFSRLLTTTKKLTCR